MRHSLKLMHSHIHKYKINFSKIDLKKESKPLLHSSETIINNLKSRPKKTKLKAKKSKNFTKKISKGLGRASYLVITSLKLSAKLTAFALDFQSPEQNLPLLDPNLLLLMKFIPP